MKIGERIAGAGTAEVYAHKLFAPRGQGGALLAIVLSDPDRRIVLLRASAGHGKTILLQQFAGECEASGYAVSSLGFDASDNDARRGFNHIFAAIAALGGGDAGSDEVEVSETNPQSRADWVVERLSRLGRPAALFLDKFQTLEEPMLLNFFRNIVVHITDNIGVFIESRSIPPLGVSRLIVNNHVVPPRTDLGISAEEVSLIDARTEGWPVALQLDHLSLGSPQVRQSLNTLENCQLREFAGYWNENVPGLQSPERLIDRERVTPAFLANGASNRQMADCILSRRIR